MRHSLWPGQTARGGSSLTGNGGRSSGRRGAEQRGVWPNVRGEKVEWAMTSSVTSEAVVRGGGEQASWGGGDQRPPALSALCAVSMDTGNRGDARDRATILGGETETGADMRAQPGFQISKLHFNL
jgi:hypothetical protein